jgi:hypothetical protein
MPLVRLAPPPAGASVTPWHDVAAFDELIASWALEPREGHEVAVQARTAAHETAWYVLGTWGDGSWASVAGQADGDGRVDVDVLRLREPSTAFRLRVLGGADVLALAACVTGEVPAAPAAGSYNAVEVPVTSRSQQTYAGLHPELDGGGGSWCSPTALAMVLGRWGIEVDVPAVARAVYDPIYAGCGNWSCNVAYAASLGLDAVVTRLPSLTAARPLLEAGVPLVLAIAAGPGDLPGFPLAAGTAGHLVVLAGETDGGDPIVHDPAAADAASVRRAYPRTPFERCWLHGSRGTAYVVRPPGVRVPPSDFW